jgi:Ala-tRNA(Pro) deacylase
LSGILGGVAGDARVNLNAVKSLLGGTYISFASPEIAEKLSGSVVGTVLPFSFTPELELIVDPGILVHEEIFFNAARLDQSMALRTSDYLAITQPRIEKIAATRRNDIGLAADNTGAGISRQGRLWGLRWFQ